MAFSPPPYLSPSGASSFDGCPRRWQHKYIDRLVDKPGPDAVAGTFAHLVLEELCKLPSKFRTIAQAKAIAGQAWSEFTESEEFTQLELSDDEARAFKWQTWLAIAGLWQIEDPATVEVVETEARVTADLAGVPFLGKIDRIDRLSDGLAVSDYKSGTLPLPRWQEDKIQQVMLYAAAVAANQEESPTSARLLYLGQSIVEVEVTEQRIAKATEQHSTTWQGIETACSEETFEAKPGVLCGWCPFVERCPEGHAELLHQQAAGRLPAHAPAAALVA